VTDEILNPSVIKDQFWCFCCWNEWQQFDKLFVEYEDVSIHIDVHCCHVGTAIKHPVPDWVKPSFVIFDIRALWRSGLRVRVPGHWVSKGLTLCLFMDLCYQNMLMCSVEPRGASGVSLTDRLRWYSISSVL